MASAGMRSRLGSGSRTRGSTKARAVATSPRHLLVLSVLLLAVAACAPIKPTTGTPGAVVWGDSFAESVRPYLTTETRAYGGTSPCDWLADIDARASESPPTVAVLLFVGNQMDTCSYATVARTITRTLQAAGTRVVWIAAPPLPGHTIPNEVYAHSGGDLAYEPARAVGHPEYAAQWRAADGLHLNDAGARRFAAAIERALRSALSQ
jgi:hypothetical protein